jgi:acetyltransferase
VVEARSGFCVQGAGRVEYNVVGLTSFREFSSTVASPESAASRQHIRLNDGRDVSIRPIPPTDLDALRAFFAALSPGALLLRFHFTIKELPESLLRKFTMIDSLSHVAFVAETHGTSAGQATTLVSEARYVRCTKSDSAEVALVVADGWRRVGLGKSLVRTLVQRASRAGVRCLCGDVLHEIGRP